MESPEKLPVAPDTKSADQLMASWIGYNKEILILKKKYRNCLTLLLLIILFLSI